MPLGAQFPETQLPQANANPRRQLSRATKAHLPPNTNAIDLLGLGHFHWFSESFSERTTQSTLERDMVVVVSVYRHDFRNLLHRNSSVPVNADHAPADLHLLCLHSFRRKRRQDRRPVETLLLPCKLVAARARIGHDRRIWECRFR